MITDVDLKKLKAVFATKDDLKNHPTKKEMNKGFEDVLNFIVETKNEIMRELNDFREEMRDITRASQSTLNNHESRISHLEYINKPI